MGKLTIFYILCLVASIIAIESNFYHEETCVKGYCVLGSECKNAGRETAENLCPHQKSTGAVCCRDFPVDHLNCAQLHNDCRQECPERLKLGRKGCPAGKTCCSLVN